jgi:hypothetical protein
MEGSAKEWARERREEEGSGWWSLVWCFVRQKRAGQGRQARDGTRQDVRASEQSLDSRATNSKALEST